MFFFVRVILWVLIGYVKSLMWKVFFFKKYDKGRSFRVCCYGLEILVKWWIDLLLYVKVCILRGKLGNIKKKWIVLLVRVKVCLVIGRRESKIFWKIVGFL